MDSDRPDAVLERTTSARPYAAVHARDGVGLLTIRGVSYLVDAMDPDDIDRDLAVIADELHCNAVMLIGRDTGRLIGCARRALERGLAVYLRPDATDLRRKDMLNQLAAVARKAELLRIEHPDRVVLFVGSEFSHTVPGIVPGPKSFIRLRLIIRFRRALRRRIERRLAQLLTRSAEVARQQFNGPLTYSAAAWEEVDWAVFDFVGVHLYRSARNRKDYRERVQTLVDGNDKPILVTEFGCGAFVGADDRGAGSFYIVNWFADPPRIRGDFARDESVQADYLTDLIDLYDSEGVHGCFAFTYAMPGFSRHDDPALDLDKAGFGLVVVDGGDLYRKQAFDAVADRFHRLARRPS